VRGVRHIAPAKKPLALPTATEALLYFTALDPVPRRHRVVCIPQPVRWNVRKNCRQRSFRVVSIVTITMVEMLDHLGFVKRDMLGKRFSSKQTRISRHVKHPHEGNRPGVLLWRPFTD